MKKIISSLLIAAMLLTVMCFDVVAASDWLETGSDSYYNVTLNSSIANSIWKRYAKVRLKTRNSVDKRESNARVHVKITDQYNNWLSEFDSKGGETLKLGNDHSGYRIYVSYYKSNGSWWDAADAFVDQGGSGEWRAVASSNCTVASVTAYKSQNTNTNTNKVLENTEYLIIPKHATYSALDTSGGNSSKYVGANIVLWEIENRYAPSRQFKLVSCGDGWYKIVSVNSGLLLDVNCSNRNVALWSDNGGSNQRWKLEDAGDGYYYIRTKASDKNGTGYYLDVNGANTSNWTNIEVYPFNGDNNQKFKFEKVY